jgi:hypothetical protein
MGPPPKKSRTGLITTLVIVAVLVVGGGGVAAFLLLRNDNNASDSADNARATADAFVKELGNQLSKPVENVNLAPLQPLTCSNDYKKLNDELDEARDDRSSTTKSPDAKKVTFGISEFKESGGGATFKMTPKPAGESAEDPINMKVIKESGRFKACGLYDQPSSGGGRESEPAGPPTKDGGDDNESIPNPIPTT